MAWKKTESLLDRRLRQHGLHDMVQAGVICTKAEELYPGLFRAVSVKNGCLHLELKKADQMKFTLVRGKLEEDISRFVSEKGLPPVDRIRLTFSRD